MSSLDARLKTRLIPYLERIRDEFRRPLIYVTDDTSELDALYGDGANADADPRKRRGGLGRSAPRVCSKTELRQRGGLVSRACRDLRSVP